MEIGFDVEVVKQSHTLVYILHESWWYSKEAFFANLFKWLALLCFL